MSMARNTPLAFVAAVLAFLLSGSYCSAGDAVFSSDGGRVYLISDIGSKPAVEEMDRNKKTSRKILLTELDSSDSLRGISWMIKRGFFCTALHSVWYVE